MKYDFDLIIVGGGSAGIVAAEAAPRMGVKAALVERQRIGGDCLWTGCVPSKALLASAKAAHTIRHADRFGLSPCDVRVDTAAVWRRIREVRRSIAETDDSPERFAGMGVEIVSGEASLEDGHTVRVGEQRLSGRYILICTGSRPAAPPIEGLAEIGFLTSESVFDIERAPESLLIIGGGPIGVEMAQAMTRLGVRTTLLEMMPRILPQEEPALSDALLHILRDEGVDVQTSADLASAGREGEGKALHGNGDNGQQTWRAEEVLVTAGRRPNIETLGLERAGVKVGQKGIEVDRTLRTSVKSIYAAGDCVGRYLFTHSAASEAILALRNMFYPGSKAAIDNVPWATFTDPELARAGMTAAEARERRGDENVQVFEWELAHNDRARAEGAAEGRIIVVTDRSHRVLGAHILSPSAGEIIGQFTQAIERKARLTEEIVNQIQVYPTFSSSVSQLAAEATYRKLDRPVYRLARRISELLGV